jgi:hypothetical protein
MQYNDPFEDHMLRVQNKVVFKHEGMDSATVSPNDSLYRVHNIDSKSGSRGQGFKSV